MKAWQTSTWGAVLLLSCLVGCTDTDPCENAGTPGATAGCVTPNRTPEYYVAQAQLYFDTLDITAVVDFDDPGTVPNYGEQVARWEWPPWLLLTGYTAADMNLTADILRKTDPSTVPIRDCRAFERQPFARCYVEFEYEGGRCPIYEEFVFDREGRMVFIEAWSDVDGLRPMGPGDRWAEAASFRRLATHVPGLGSASGGFDLGSSWMQEAAEANEDVADFALRAADWWGFWFEQLSVDPDFFARGCGWPLD